MQWLGERYGDRIEAWWFDSPYSLDPRGPVNTVTTDLGGSQFPWETMTVAAKAGHAERLVTYNPGINESFLYTTHQDYWAGELRDLSAPPSARYLDNGLQWHGWTCLDDRRWVHGALNTDAAPPLYSDEALANFLSTCSGHRAPMCFNVVVYQDGSVSRRAVEQLRRVGERLRDRGREKWKIDSAEKPPMLWTACWAW